MKVYWTSPDGLFGNVVVEDIQTALQVRREYEAQGCKAMILIEGGNCV